MSVAIIETRRRGRKLRSALKDVSGKRRWVAFCLLSAAVGIPIILGIGIDDGVHLVNAYRNQSEHDPLAAVRETGAAILLTSLTTFAGLTPLMLERSMQAQFLIPMAVSLAFGVMFATVVTLLVLPCGYLVLEDLRDLLQRRRSNT